MGRRGRRRGTFAAPTGGHCIVRMRLKRSRRATGKTYDRDICLSDGKLLHVGGLGGPLGSVILPDGIRAGTELTARFGRSA